MLQPTSDACLALLEEAGLIAPVLESLLAAVQRHLSRRAEAMRVGAVIFSNTRGLLGMTEQAERMIREWRMP
jgi:cobalt-precorrin-5B (C1)-methyltransferase